MASQTWMVGTFDRELTASSVGTLQPAGRATELNLHNIFRYGALGCLAEKWAIHDEREFLRQLGVASR